MIQRWLDGLSVPVHQRQMTERSIVLRMDSGPSQGESHRMPETALMLPGINEGRAQASDSLYRNFHTKLAKVGVRFVLGGWDLAGHCQEGWIPFPAQLPV